MIYHVLNGDALASTFTGAGITGEIIITREALIDGDLRGDTLEAFWQTRAHYIEPANENRYYTFVVKEFNKLLSAEDNAEFNLWFGYDLFCQVNMWFIISLLQETPANKNIFVVNPSFRDKEDRWKDFGKATHGNLHTSLKNRVLFGGEDIQLAQRLWTAYKNNNLEELKSLSKTTSVCFPYLREVCQAHIDRFPSGNNKGRPEQVIKDIVQNVSPDFHIVFREFFTREGVYGFGDSQLKPLYDKVMSEY